MVPAPWLRLLGLSALLLTLPFAVRLTGRPHADWLQFLGRFHPLLVHLPIGLIAIFPLLEFMGARRPALRDAAGFVLLFALAACSISIFFGLLLAYGSGENGTTVTRHMRGAIALTLELMLCVGVRRSWLAEQRLRSYSVLLAAILITLAWTAHQGGSLTHGSDYLTRYMPSTLKRFIAPSV